MSRNWKRSRLPVVLEPISVSERHEQLNDDTEPRTADKQRSGVYSRFIQDQEIRLKDDLVPLPSIKSRYVQSLPVSNTYKVDIAPTNPNTIQVTKDVKKKPSKNETMINYRKAVEPKVMLPFETRKDQTPRKIDIERKKRQYSSKDIKKLIQIELDSLKANGLLPSNSYHSKVNREGNAESDSEKVEINNHLSHLLPLEVFDDVEFDTRTPDDWLNMSVIPDTEDADKTINRKERAGIVKDGYENIRFANIPLPAKAFDSLEWRDCLVIAHDDSNGQWKVKWRSYNGWELDKKVDATNHFVHPEDEGLIEEIEGTDGDPRSVIDGKELWVNRYFIIT
jgi:hypothetical protein